MQDLPAGDVVWLQVSGLVRVDGQFCRLTQPFGYVAGLGQGFILGEAAPWGCGVLSRAIACR
jgi:hypothetical protein